MKKLFFALLLLTTVARAETYRLTDTEGTVHLADNGSVAPQVDQLKERMQQDEEVMALIRAMQNDPEMQALLSDPAIIAAIQAGDISALTSNPDFMKLLNNPGIRAIEQKMQQNGTR